MTDEMDHAADELARLGSTEPLSRFGVETPIVHSLARTLAAHAGCSVAYAEDMIERAVREDPAYWRATEERLSDVLRETAGQLVKVSVSHTPTPKNPRHPFARFMA